MTGVPLGEPVNTRVPDRAVGLFGTDNEEFPGGIDLVLDGFDAV